MSNISYRQHTWVILHDFLQTNICQACIAAAATQGLDQPSWKTLCRCCGSYPDLKIVTWSMIVSACCSDWQTILVTCVRVSGEN